jgi:hypothetical protein
VIGVTTLLYAAGNALLGVALRRAGVLATPTSVALVAGALLTLVPPAPLSPAPWGVFVAGCVVLGAGLAGLGLALGRVPAGAPSLVPAAAAG